MDNVLLSYSEIGENSMGLVPCMPSPYESSASNSANSMVRLFFATFSRSSAASIFCGMKGCSRIAATRTPSAAKYIILLCVGFSSGALSDHGWVC